MMQIFIPILLSISESSSNAMADLKETDSENTASNQVRTTLLKSLLC